MLSKPIIQCQPKSVSNYSGHMCFCRELLARADFSFAGFVRFGSLYEKVKS